MTARERHIKMYKARAKAELCIEEAKYFHQLGDHENEMRMLMRADRYWAEYNDLKKGSGKVSYSIKKKKVAPKRKRVMGKEVTIITAEMLEEEEAIDLFQTTEEE